MYPLAALALASALVAPAAVNAHGFVKQISISGGKTWRGWDFNTDPYVKPRPELAGRQIPGDGPVQDLTSSNMNCNGLGSQGAALVAPAAAGSKVEFDWTSWPADHMGPVSTYMTSCNGNCVDFDPTNAEWFKIDAAGVLDDKKWASTHLIEAGNKWTSTIPADLKDGEYLIRNEIIALHSQPAQVYPSCFQVKVTGGGSKAPSGSELVKMTELYKQSDFPDIWSDAWNASPSFKIPGPAAIGSSTGSGSTDTGASTSASSAASSSPAKPPSTSQSGSPLPTSTAAHTASATLATGSKLPASSTPTSTHTSAASSATSTSGKCAAKRRRRSTMVKRRVSHHAKLHH